MPTFRTGVVTAVTAERPGLQRVLVDLGAGDERAYVLTELIGPTATGHRVVVNTTAVALGLGTGGWHVVHWDLEREGLDRPGAGHVLKLRYSSLQADVGVAEEVEGYEPPADLGGRPVVVCLLHSQLAAVAVAIAHAAPGTSVAYVMTDGAALPLALSDLVHDVCGAGLLATTVTAGQAFGGALEAVNVPSALDVAAPHADVIVVAPGPGVVGTGSARGFTGLEAAAALDAAARARGRPVLAVRASDADARPRHRGTSHHTTAVLGATAAPPLVAVPAGEAAPPGCSPVVVDVPDVAGLLAAAGLSVTTMGRGPAEDPAAFRWSAAAGVLAARLLAR